MDHVLAITVIDAFTETDEKLCQKWFLEKQAGTRRPISVLVKLDEARISGSSVKAFFEDALFALRHYKEMGHLAIVAHSNVLRALVPIDNLFFERASRGREERYFDASRLEEAMAFVKDGPKA